LNEDAILHCFFGRRSVRQDLSPTTETVVPEAIEGIMAELPCTGPQEVEEDTGSGGD
jgi:hypothetical protein